MSSRGDELVVECVVFVGDCVSLRARLALVRFARMGNVCGGVGLV